MTQYETLKRKVELCRDKLKTKYANESCGHPLDAKGDELRRVAATKMHVLDDVIKDMKEVIKEV